MRVRVDIHVEPDHGAIEAWITTYDADGHQEECYSTHDEKVLSTLNGVLESSTFGLRRVQLQFDPFC
jgi:hypothetical protein